MQILASERLIDHANLLDVALHHTKYHIVHRNRKCDEAMQYLLILEAVTLPNESGVLLNLNSNGQSQQFVFVEHLLRLFSLGQYHDHERHGCAAAALQSNDVERAISPLLQFSLNLSIRKVDGNSSNHRVDVPFRRERKSRNIVYNDETYMNSSHTVPKAWDDGTDN
ncbi:unnamed protein product [Acanthoscelides obtectus]|uniref:Uncharacterized protein n=1 Tax=Acanthoscelides obtectus TaxID=200917 RepID=A0A9P0P0F0_ACAOB|nr:unnamed protein product [Acanthoscelides obtectus]CAK1633833.1 hypothetical protein AOBTE_LOCUS8420 [Acanthoscelides obtectus]